MIKLTLVPRGATKGTVYESIGVRMRETLEAFALLKEWETANGDYPEELVDRCIAFIVRCFGDKFTVEELMDGYQGSAYALIPQMLQEVLTYVAQRISAFPLPEAKAQATRA